jgi:hypothetical protein
MEQRSELPNHPRRSKWLAALGMGKCQTYHMPKKQERGVPETQKKALTNKDIGKLKILVPCTQAASSVRYGGSSLLEEGSLDNARSTLQKTKEKYADASSAKITR